MTLNLIRTCLFSTKNIICRRTPGNFALFEVDNGSAEKCLEYASKSPVYGLY